MKPIISIVSTDWHLKRHNLQKIYELISFQCQLAKKCQLNEIIVLGDVFDDRKSQTQDVLIAFRRILDLCAEHGVTMIIIPGNHDKTDYCSEDSFLYPFNSHQNLNLVSDYQYIKRGKYTYHFIPYFDENALYKQYLEKVKYQGNDILFSHIALTGSVNNDYSTIDNALKLDDFRRFIKVYLGHYHNMQIIGKNVVHLPSIYQSNYGEDGNKGYTVIYDDMTHQIVRSKFKKYVSVDVDIGDLSTDDILQKVKRYNTSLENVRLVLRGKELDYKSINVSKLKDCGFHIMFKQTDVFTEGQSHSKVEIKPYDHEGIKLYFKEYCNNNQLNYHTGYELLKLAFK